MRLILLCACLMLSLARAEVLPEKMIQQLASEMQASCVKASWDSIGMSLDEREKSCACSGSSFAAGLRTADISSIRQPTDADRARVAALKSQAIDECQQPYVERKLTSAFNTICLSNAKTLPQLKALSKAKLESVCTCAAQDLAHDREMLVLGAAEDKKAAAEKSAVKWRVAFEACGAKS